MRDRLCAPSCGSLRDPRHLRELQGTPRARHETSAGKLRHDGAERYTRGAVLPHERDDLLLALVMHEPPVDVGAEAERHFARTFPAGPLRGESRFCPRTDKGTLVGRSSIDHRAHEDVGRAIAIRGAISGEDLRAAGLRSALDRGSDDDVTREPVTLRDDEDARANRTKLTKGGDECRTIREIASATHARVDVPCHDGDAFALGPRLDRSALRLGPKPLLFGRDAKVRDGDERVSRAGAAFVTAHVF